MEKKNDTDTAHHTAILNRKARHEYEVIDSFEAGIVLHGSEVKSIRQGKANLQDSYGVVKRGEVWLVNMHISPYEQANRFNHEPLRERKLLLHKSEIRKLVGKTAEKGLTLVPLKAYFSKGHIKIDLGLCRGKKSYDRREDIKRRDVEREMRRSLHRNQ